MHTRDLRARVAARGRGDFRWFLLVVLGVQPSPREDVAIELWKWVRGEAILPMCPEGVRLARGEIFRWLYIEEPQNFDVSSYSVSVAS